MDLNTAKEVQVSDEGKPMQSSPSTANIWNSFLNKFSATSLGQYTLKKVNNVLIITENVVKWAVPPKPKKTENESHTSTSNLKRPLPWILFLPALVLLRVALFTMDCVTFVNKKDKVTALKVVQKIQKIRRNVRAVRYSGNKERCNRRASRLNFLARVSSILCFRPQLQEEPEAKAIECNPKRKYSDISNAGDESTDDQYEHILNETFVETELDQTYEVSSTESDLSSSDTLTESDVEEQDTPKNKRELEKPSETTPSNKKPIEAKQQSSKKKSFKSADEQSSKDNNENKETIESKRSNENLQRKNSENGAGNAENHAGNSETAEPSNKEGETENEQKVLNGDDSECGNGYYSDDQFYSPIGSPVEPSNVAENVAISPAAVPPQIVVDNYDDKKIAPTKPAGNTYRKNARHNNFNYKANRTHNNKSHNFHNNPHNYNFNNGDGGYSNEDVQPKKQKEGYKRKYPVQPLKEPVEPVNNHDHP